MNLLMMKLRLLITLKIIMPFIVYVEVSRMQFRILFLKWILANLFWSMRWIIVVMIIMIRVLNKSTNLEILQNQLRNLSLSFYILLVGEVRIPFTMQFCLVFTISLKIRKRSVELYMTFSVGNERPKSWQKWTEKN